MTAKKGTPLREFYLSRARILYARRNIPGGEKILSCLYISLIAAPKKAMVYLLHGKFRLAAAVTKAPSADFFHQNSKHQLYPKNCQTPSPGISTFAAIYFINTKIMKKNIWAIRY